MNPSKVVLTIERASNGFVVTRDIYELFCDLGPRERKVEFVPGEESYSYAATCVASQMLVDDDTVRLLDPAEHTRRASRKNEKEEVKNEVPY